MLSAPAILSFPMRLAHLFPHITEPLHALAQIRQWRPQYQVVMILHQTVAVNLDAKPLLKLGEQIAKSQPILIIRKDRPPFDPPVHHVIPIILNIDAQRSCHAPDFPGQANCANT